MSGLSAGPPPEAFDPSGDNDGADSSPPDGPEGEPDEWWGLRRTQPPIAPSEVGRQLDLEATWWQHLGAGFIKQSGSQGAEAWMHYVMAAFLITAEIAGLEVGDDDDEIGSDTFETDPEANAGLEPTGDRVTDGKRTFDGPQ